jgi:hypothetical protein
MAPCARHQAHGGFATFADGNPLSWHEQRRKLELVVDTGRKVWGESSA